MRREKPKKQLLWNGSEVVPTTGVSLRRAASLLREGIIRPVSACDRFPPYKQPSRSSLLITSRQYMTLQRNGSLEIRFHRIPQDKMGSHAATQHRKIDRDRQSLVWDPRGMAHELLSLGADILITTYFSPSTQYTKPVGYRSPDTAIHKSIFELKTGRAAHSNPCDRKKALISSVSWICYSYSSRSGSTATAWRWRKRLLLTGRLIGSRKYSRFKPIKRVGRELTIDDV